MNRKGFTLVELLAVIILLAVVTGITIPAIFTTIERARKKTFQASADSVADWFSKQYQMQKVGIADAGMAEINPNFEIICGTDNCTRVAGINGATETGIILDTTTGSDDEKEMAKNIIATVGLKVSNISKIYIYIDEATGRTCVKLNASHEGDYYDVVEGNMVKSGNCN